MDNGNYFKQKKFEMVSKLGCAENSFPYECYNGFYIFRPLIIHDADGNMH